MQNIPENNISCQEIRFHSPINKMPFGWTGKILNINLTDKSIKEENTTPYTRKYIGERILAARLARTSHQE